MAAHRVQNLCPDFFAFWERARRLGLSEQKELWRTLYEERHRAVFDVYYSHFGSRAALDRALQRSSSTPLVGATRSPRWRAGPSTAAWLRREVLWSA
jgi:hypothetical protein